MINSLNSWADYTGEYISFFENDIKIFNEKFLRLTNNLNSKNKYFFGGNGASAAICSHISNDFSKTLKLKSYTFHDPALITCFANDYGFENWISEAIKVNCSRKDVLILLSSSGKSKNIVNAALTAKELGMMVITLTGPTALKKLLKLSDLYIEIKSFNYNTIECCHMIALCSVIDKLKKVEIKR